MKTQSGANYTVASFTDAWIETPLEAQSGMLNVSHLLQMRGLKHPSGGYQVVRAMSHLLQMRGLKQKKHWQGYNDILSHLLQMRGLKPFILRQIKIMTKVASFTDAWIETHT